MEKSWHLEKAAGRGDAAEVRKLLAQGAASGLAPRDAAKIFVDAVSAPAATAELVKMLLSAGLDPNGVDDRIGEWYATTPFVAAVRRLRLDLMEVLLKAGANLHWKNTNGANAATAVFPSSCQQEPCKASAEQACIAAWLEERGVRIDPASAFMQRQLFYSAYTKNSWQDIAGHLARGTDPRCLKWTPFMLKLVLGEATAEEAAALPAAEQEHADGWNRTPFLLAVMAGRQDIAGALIEAGCDPWVTGHWGMNALHCAAQCDHGDIVRWLLDLGLHVDSQDDSADSPLMTATGAGSLRAAKALLDAGANVHACDRNGFQAIHDASAQEMIALLLAAGADVNAISGGGDWPLKSAAHSGDCNLVRMLLKAGAKIDLTSSGDTALFAAVFSRSLECVSLLLDAGANILARDCDGCPCIWGADSIAMAELLLQRGAEPFRCQTQSRDVREFIARWNEGPPASRRR
jgi:ankyrin repeat protein